MNRTLRKPSYFKLIMGLSLAVIGFSGLGYVPGKPLYFTFICALLLVAGITSVCLYLEDMRLYRRSEEGRNRHQSVRMGGAR